MEGMSRKQVREERETSSGFSGEINVCDHRSSRIQETFHSDPPGHLIFRERTRSNSDKNKS